MVKNVLITGGAGAIGVHFIGYFMLNTDWNVIVLDSFQHKGYFDRIKTLYRRNSGWKDRIKVIQHNLTCEINQDLMIDIGPVDYIIHLAAMSDVFFSVENPVWVIRNNIESTLTMLEYAKQVSHKAFIYFSTDEVYGPVKKGGRHKEWSTHRPSNAYAASKAASEDICYAYWRKGDVNLIITNTMNNFGEMQSPSKFPAMIQKKIMNMETIEVHGNKKNIGSRYYIHSRNVADAILYILNNFPVTIHREGRLDEPDRYHIVGQKCINNLELVEIIADLMDEDFSYELVDFHKDNPAHDIHYGLKDSKLRKDGWREPIPFKKSLRDTIKWQKENPEWINQ